MSHEVDPGWPPPAGEPSDDVDTTPPTAESPSGRTLWLLAVLVTLVCIVAIVTFVGNNRRPGANHAPVTTASSPPTSAAPASTATGPGPCGPDEATAIAAALAKLPPDSKTGKPWNSTPESSNYNPCAELSAVVLTVQDATRSSPDQALMFHRGTFVGTATPKAYPFTHVEGPASTNNIVVLTYRTRQSCDACEDGILTTVGFRWEGDRVQMLDRPPELVDSPP